MVKCMNHLVSHCVFEMSLVFHFICANQDAIFWVKATTLAVCAATAMNVVIMKVASQLFNALT